jgi:hypothetical protein
MMELILPMVKKYPANDFGLYDMVECSRMGLMFIDPL